MSSKEFKASASAGSAAIAIFAEKLQERGLDLVSVEGTEKDLVDGIDYELYKEGKLVAQGAHRHMSSQYENYAALRFRRSSGVATDYQKLGAKAPNFLLSFSNGFIGPRMRIVTTTAKAVREWIDEHRADLNSHVEYPFGKNDSAFLMIPFDELNKVRII